MRPDPPRAKTGAERQAAYAERRRNLTPLERDLRLEAEEIYTPDELVLVARIRRQRELLLADSRRLNTRLRCRLLADLMRPGASSGERERTNRTLLLLSHRSLLCLPEF